jgi:hypothetical protein
MTHRPTKLLEYFGTAKLLVAQYQGKTLIIRSEHVDDRMWDVVIPEDYPVEIKLEGERLTLTRLHKPGDWPDEPGT